MADITSNLVAWYKLDETSGTSAVDSSGNGYTGTYTNSPTLGVGGAFGGSKSVTLASESSQAVMTGSIDLSGTQKVTVAMWVKTSATSGNLLELSTNYNSVSDSFCLLISGANALQFGVKGNSGYNTSEVTTTLDGTWKHVVVVMDTTVAAANQVVPYINGVAASYSKALSNANSNAFGNRAVYIASRAASSVFLSGTIDDVRIYSRALSANDVAALYSQSLSTATSILQAPAKTITEVSPLMVANATYPYIFRSRTL